GHLDIEVFEEFTDLWLTHVTAILKRHDQRSQISAEITMVTTGGQWSSIVALFCRRVEDLPL
ncbi:MAG TPA: hypothetical protein DEW32_04285, partial [Dehalococcoidia bacterium]|nr:hypothetical protein [Dehalococcoidia bacterium]